MSSISRELLTVVIPTLNAAAGLRATLKSVSCADEVVVVDGGSSDGTVDIAKSFGARVLSCSRGRGRQLAKGTACASGPWLLILHADTILTEGWEQAARAHMRGAPDRAGYFRLSLDDADWRARIIEGLVALRCAMFGLPYGDQGLLISRRLLRDAGGFLSLALMEDVDLALRLGRRRLTPLAASALTSADRWRRDGWVRRSLRNLRCLGLFIVGVAPDRIARTYER